MLGVESGTAEEFYSRCLANAQHLEAAARQRAAAGDRVGALADAWGADVSTLQAVLWERVIAASRAPQRQFFQAAEAIVAGLRSELAEPESSATLGRSLAQARARITTAFDEDTAREMARRWPDISYLEAVPPVTVEDLSAAVSDRLRGLTPVAFVAQRRGEAAAAMMKAQAHRVRGETSEAIQAAYAGDFGALEAYLVESATEVGDVELLSVITRWDLAVHAVSEVPGLPEDFSQAVNVVRKAMVAGLGDADGKRLLETLTPA